MFKRGEIKPPCNRLKSAFMSMQGNILIEFYTDCIKKPT